MLFFSHKKSKIFANTKLKFIITSRLHGFSKPPFDSLNLAYHVKDNSDHVRKNREIVLKSYFPQKKLVWLNQVHGNQILIPHTHGMIGDGDGILCNDPSYVSMIMVADCMPVCIFDSKNHVFSLLHCGRAGIFTSIIPIAIHKMQKMYQSQINDLYIYLGPCLKACCYEIQEDIITQTKQLFPKISQSILHKKDKKTFLDLTTLVLHQLNTLKIPQKNIEISPICTKHTPNLFSYRREKNTGRFAILASLQT
ncbi:peptidoglycan editing factor PgeF [Helicobacter anatolicus]|uniref:peptidoglycan editing factor PgeF n=1 Tax=Helicobacter anatolicus TaxID=2905874 RepID=UPI001E411753|nr:peptidoglycan editing factor PgeF [Helicobacter anatolicus]MCE3040390.1 peptidoglycan editing factor PgeF [Helicobacter anatolicus]